jgi:biopolymer transport protein ExbD
MIRARAPRRRREPTIALINIVFLMLVFFMVAGTLAQPLEPDLSLVRTAELEGRAPPDTLVVRADGTLRHRGETLPDAASFWAREQPQVARIVPDRDLDARRLVEIARALRLAGAERVMIVTERGLE